VVSEEGGFKTVRQQDTKTKNKTINRIRKTRHTKDKWKKQKSISSEVKALHRR
jgi:hypothetical protein